MREIKIIPLVLSILGLISLGYGLTEAIKSTEVLVLSLYLMVILIFVLLLSVGVFDGKKNNKFVW
jgi:hypothetical protein